MSDDFQAADEVYVAMYPYESGEPGDLTFVAGEMITVTKKEGDWWTGSIGSSRTGVFPSNYVQKAELQSEAAADSEVEAATAAGKAAAEALQFADSLSNGKRPNTAPVDSEIEVFHDFNFVCVVVDECVVSVDCLHPSGRLGRLRHFFSVEHEELEEAGDCDGHRTVQCHQLGAVVSAARSTHHDQEEVDFRLVGGRASGNF